MSVSSTPSFGSSKQNAILIDDALGPVLWFRNPYISPSQSDEHNAEEPQESFTPPSSRHDSQNDAFLDAQYQARDATPWPADKVPSSSPPAALRHASDAHLADAADGAHESHHWSSPPYMPLSPSRFLSPTPTPDAATFHTRAPSLDCQPHSTGLEHFDEMMTSLRITRRRLDERRSRVVKRRADLAALKFKIQERIVTEHQSARLQLQKWDDEDAHVASEHHMVKEWLGEMGIELDLAID